MCGASRRTARGRRAISRQMGALPAARGGSSLLRTLGIMVAYTSGGIRLAASARAELSREGASRQVLLRFVGMLSRS